MAELPEPTNFVIRHATAEDADALAEFAEKNFRGAFGPDNDPGDVEEHCRNSYSPTIQRAQINDPLVVTLIAFDPQDKMAAYVQLRPGAPPEGTAPNPIELWHFYVDAAYHGRGLAYQLMDATLDAAGERGARTVWLSVWERNPRAQRFYRKVGFTEIGTQTFMVGNDPQRDLLLARPIG